MKDKKRERVKEDKDKRNFIHAGFDVVEDSAAVLVQSEEGRSVMRKWAGNIPEMTQVFLQALIANAGTVKPLNISVDKI